MWAVNEFSLKGVDFQKFCMNGAALCALGKDCFLELAPDFVGDILWEHLEILQKGKCMRTGWGRGGGACTGQLPESTGERGATSRSSSGRPATAHTVCGDCRMVPGREQVLHKC